VGLPITALWGVVFAINEVDRLAQDPTWVAELNAKSNPGNVDLTAWSESWNYTFFGLYVLFILLFFVTRKVVHAIKKKRSGVLIKYLEGAEVFVAKGTSLLGASLQANIPHAHVCGGRGRCSTCPVQIVEGLADLPPRSNEEALLLDRLNCGSAVRLACRTKPLAPCTIYPLLLPDVSLKRSLWQKNNYTGTDRDVAILFTDLRGFTAMAEHKLPYDVVFVLNQYFQSMGQAVEAHHGRIDKFIGDAIMAVFGVETDKKQACRDALAAARSMRLQLDRLNAQLRSELTEPLKMGFGIHCGHVIIGEMGYKDSNNLVAIGDATNTASRLESLTKDFDCEMVVSKDVVDWAELDFSKYDTHAVELRGRQKPVQVYTLSDIRQMEV
jgi:adenylate cyclase